MTELATLLASTKPEIALILGSSLGQVAELVEQPDNIPYKEIKDFPLVHISGHKGQLIRGQVGGRSVVVLAGRAHPYEQGKPAVMQPVIKALQEAGVKTLILTNAAGSLSSLMAPGSLMMITDHINYAGMNPLVGAGGGDQDFVSMTNAYDSQLQNHLILAADAEGIKLHKGVYIWYSGPSFETPAEIKMFQMLGGNAEGMSTVPETILARRYGLKVMGISVITNLAAGIDGASPSHEETKREGQKAVGHMKKLLHRFILQHKGA